MNTLLECTNHDKFSRSTTLPPAFSDADCELFNAAYDHALIGWAMVAHVIGIADGNLDEPCSGVEVIFYLEPAQFICRLDPFGFPVLTDDLRARLIAEMGGTP